MTSTIKVDKLYATDGTGIRPKDLGLVATGMPVQITQVNSGGRATFGGNVWTETNCTHSITPLYNDSKFICHAHQNFRFYANGGTIFRGGVRLKRRIGGGSWTVLTNTVGHRETFQTRTPSSVTNELGDVFVINFLDSPDHNGQVVEYVLEANMTIDSGPSVNQVISWEGDRGNYMNITEIAG